MTIKRRDFLKLAGITSASLLPTIAQAETDACPHDYQDAYAVLVDATVCIGCRKCELACNQEHDLSDAPPADFDDMSVFASTRRLSETAYTVVNRLPDDKNHTRASFLKQQCMHCNEPACVSACIVGALSKCEHGPVTWDPEKCIGCRYCMVACPFGVPTFEYEKALEPRIMKCTFCTERVHDGRRPACVAACPAETLTFGKRGELIALAHSKIRQHPQRYVDHVYGEHEIGGTSWMYLAGMDFDKTELPRLSDEPIPQHTETIQHAIFKWFMPPLALYGFLGLVMHSLRHDPNKEEPTS